jgi:3-oxoacyl-[acyl-carrier-protein] synthase-1
VIVRLALTGTGLATALGFTRQSCAAIRAGLSRPRIALGTEVDDGDGNMSPAVVIPSDFANGFLQTGAWVRLGELAIEALRRGHEIPADARDVWGRTALVALTPVVDADRFTWSLADSPDALQGFVDRLARLSELPFAAGTVRAVEAGHCGLARVLEAVDRALAQRQVDRVLLAAADSYVDSMSLGWLAARGRLKAPEQPVGLIPGEAGAALLAETELAARQRRAAPLAFVEGVAHAALPPVATPPRRSPGAKEEEDGDEQDELPPPPPPAPALGRLIADVVRRALAAAQVGAPFRGDVLLDLNGEVWKANGWGYAQVHLTAAIDFDACRLHLPAESLGETGAASAPIAVSYAIHLFERARSRRALVVSIADDGAAAAIVLGAGRDVGARDGA